MFLCLVNYNDQKLFITDVCSFFFLQANLEDSFLADLEDLSDNDNENLGAFGMMDNMGQDDTPVHDEDNGDAEHIEEDINRDLVDMEVLNYDDLDSVSKLQKTQRYTDIMKKVEDALEKGSDISNQSLGLEDDPEYLLIVECNTLLVDIENEIVIIHNFVRDKYRLKFPELESVVHHPIDYECVVKKIGNEVDLTLVDLAGLLPSAVIMVISVTASTTSGKPLPEDVLQKTIEACDRALTLDAAKKKVLDFVESRMGYIAPNLSAIVGSAVAAKLMGTAGGLSALSKIPACDVQVLGAKRKNLAGFSSATSHIHVGYLDQTEVFQMTPPVYKMRACRLLAAKATLAARIDCARGDPSGQLGRTYREEVHKKIEKWQEPPPAKQPKPLPVPDSEPKKKRGGRRLRKRKERYAMTDMRKLANRMQFGVPEESSLGLGKFARSRDGLGEGYGMLGQAGNGKLRVSAGQSNLAAKVAKKLKDNKQYSNGGATSGLTSSLAFTPVQGIDLIDPQANANRLGKLPKLYIDFARMIFTQFSKPIKILRADNAMEYKESSLLSFLESQGTLSQYSCPGTSPQNAFTAVYTINRHPTPILQNKSPYEILHGVSPAYDLLKVWGCACFVQLQPHEHTKLEPRARVCLFLGYDIEHKGYRCWDPISKRLRISRHVTFWEDVPFYTMPNAETSITSITTPFFTDPSSSFDTPISPPIPTTDPDLPITTSDLPQPVPTPSPTPEAPAESTDPGPSTSDAVRRSNRVRQVPAHLRDYHCYATLLSNHEPASYKEAASSSQWQEAMQEELRALAKAHTWDPAPLPPGKRPIGPKWVFKIKTKSDGSVDRYKTRLVAKGFNQEYDIDYEETFAPVARVTSVRSLLAIAATKRWPLFQMDVKNAFLNGDLSEEVYMTPPPGVSLPSSHVYRLRKALYGLKQDPRAWFEKFSKTVLSLGFSASNYDSGLFTRTTASGSILLLLYVDDMIITGDDSIGIASLKQSLSSSFEMKDLGKLHYFLGLEVLSDSSGIYLCQAKYISDLLSKAGLSDNKVASTPLEHNLHLAPKSGPLLRDATRYRQLVGSLVYFTVTRPDIAYAVHTVSQFMAAPCSLITMLLSSGFSVILKAPCFMGYTSPAHHPLSSVDTPTLIGTVT
ncbi:hypothetical protein OSB04_018582 [Centaurea solstitialis]|uniref:Nop domain-containing protein n=1 Tax=Centaurea solstitialis TaxID=347529 RepID=A0AA38WBP3_9ASTR|nr:hypothetical protein OSB04_018582 [Centaurea solstitialis]